MCKTCNGTGGINIEHSWGIEFHPCPSTNCDYDREKEVKKMLQYIDYRTAKMKGEIA